MLNAFKGEFKKEINRNAYWQTILSNWNEDRKAKGMVLAAPQLSCICLDRKQHTHW